MEKYKKISDLIIAVLCRKITVQEALNDFPKDSSDINIKCSFDALIHYEADEDIRNKDKEYAQTQDDYLEFIATKLANNENLPNNIAQRYIKYHKYNLLSDNKKGIKSFAKYIKRMINF